MKLTILSHTNTRNSDLKYKLAKIIVFLSINNVKLTNISLRVNLLYHKFVQRYTVNRYEITIPIERNFFGIITLIWNLLHCILNYSLQYKHILKHHWLFLWFLARLYIIQCHTLPNTYFLFNLKIGPATNKISQCKPSKHTIILQTLGTSLCYVRYIIHKCNYLLSKS